VSSITRRVTPTEKLDVVKSDSDDNKIVECAVAAGSDYLVTGDNNILSLGSYGKTRMIKPSDFLGIALNLSRVSKTPREDNEWETAAVG
jgi:predicted nucleic acid-binding protein